MNENPYECSDSSNSTIIEADIDYNLECISNKYTFGAKFTTDATSKLHTNNTLETKHNSEPKCFDRDSTEDQPLNCNLESTKPSLSDKSSFNLSHTEPDLDELNSILKKYSNYTSACTSSTTSNNSKSSVSKAVPSSVSCSDLNDEPIELSSDDDFPLVNTKIKLSPVLEDYIPDVDTAVEDLQELSQKYTSSPDKDVNKNLGSLKSVIQEENDFPCPSPKKKRKIDPDKEKKRLEKAAQQAQKREELVRSKQIKQAFITANKNMKPEECMKFITVVLDTQIANEKYGGEILNALQAADVAYQLQSQLISHTVMWNRKIQNHTLNDDNKLTETSKIVEADEILLILNCNQIVDLIQNQLLLQHIESVKSVLANKKLLLAIYGLEGYFKYQKSQKQKKIRAKVTETAQKSNNKYHEIYKDMATINKKQLEVALTELQMLSCCCHRLIDTPQDMGAMIVQYTKAIAQAPYKLERHQKHQEAEWYMGGDNKDCVRVDKNGNGLQRLWQQQLTTFPLARLELAEAITSQYSTPLSLMEKYSQISQDEGEKLLQDIPIRRAAGPLTTVRKIGPELSKKVFTFFTSVNGDVEL